MLNLIVILNLTFMLNENENTKLNAEQIKRLTEKLKQKACVETAAELKSERENCKFL